MGMLAEQINFTSADSYVITGLRYVLALNAVDLDMFFYTEHGLNTPVKS